MSEPTTPSETSSVVKYNKDRTCVYLLVAVAGAGGGAGVAVSVMTFAGVFFTVM